MHTCWIDILEDMQMNLCHYFYRNQSATKAIQTVNLNTFLR